jgi:hypothetical protein
MEHVFRLLRFLLEAYQETSSPSPYVSQLAGYPRTPGSLDFDCSCIYNYREVECRVTSRSVTGERTADKDGISTDHNRQQHWHAEAKFSPFLLV